MHFPIIEINRVKKTRNEIKESSVDYESPTLNYFCDYFGEKYTWPERNELIKSEELKELFAGIADIDAKNESITFKSKEEIGATLSKYFADTLEELEKYKDKDGYMRFLLLRQKGNDYRDNCTLFNLDDVVYTSMQFFEDTYFYAGQTLYFGQIFDAHC